MDFSLEDFEASVLAGEWETSYQRLVRILVVLNEHNGVTDTIWVRYHPERLTPEESERYLASRIAQAIGHLFLSPGFMLSRPGFCQLMGLQRWISSLFAAGPTGNADHLIRLLGGVRADDPNALLTAALLSSAVACFVDYQLTPQRLQPGFEKRLSTPSMVAVYAAFGLGLVRFDTVRLQLLPQPVAPGCGRGFGQLPQLRAQRAPCRHGSLAAAQPGGPGFVQGVLFKGRQVRPAHRHPSALDAIDGGGQRAGFLRRAGRGRRAGAAREAAYNRQHARGQQGQCPARCP